MSSREDQAREVLLSLANVDWDAALEPESFPPGLLAGARDQLAAWRRADIDWIVQHADPSLVIQQPAELPDARTYHGPDGILESILDWPVQWDHFEMEPRRIFAVGSNQVVTVALHRGHARQIAMEVEAEIVWLTRWRDDLLVRWDMFMNLDEALRVAEAVENE